METQEYQDPFTHHNQVQISPGGTNNELLRGLTPQNSLYRYLCCDSGPRYTNSLMFHEHISHEYILKFGITTEDIPKYIQKELTLEEQTAKRSRAFEGMNPDIKNPGLIFNSHFESGNLDLVVQVS